MQNLVEGDIAITMTSKENVVRDIGFSKCLNDNNVYVAFGDKDSHIAVKVERGRSVLVIRNGVSGFSLVENLEIGDVVLEFKEDSGRGPANPGS